jgi:hypothetical protein
MGGDISSCDLEEKNPFFADMMMCVAWGIVTSQWTVDRGQWTVEVFCGEVRICWKLVF